MVKVGIIGAGAQLSGEIIRILINHPETEIVSLFEPSLRGRNVASVHHGLIGEQSLFFTDKINLDEIDFLIIAENSDFANSILNNTPENVKTVVLPIQGYNNLINENVEPGVSEINRKALVRGAKTAVIPSPASVPALIALAPLAAFLLLNSDIEIEIDLPDDLTTGIDTVQEENLISRLLKTRQTSFNGNINIKINGQKNSERKGISRITMKSGMPAEEIERIYEEVYDDHNFTFISSSEVDSKEVEGTQKTVIKVTKETPDTLTLAIVADPRMRGGAGDAVHVMNLFFGLHEKTGLHLKSSRY